MSPIAAPEAVATITSRIASIESQIRSVSPTTIAGPAGTATATISATGQAASAAAPSSSATAFQAALSDAAQAADPSPRATQVSGPGAASSLSPTSSAIVSSTGPDGDDLVASAKKYLGVPYVWGGTSPSGLDCSGLVQLAAKDLGIDLPRVSRDQAKTGEAVPSMAEAKPGDLIAFGSPVNHIAIYVGNNQILEAPQPGQDVHITEIHRTPVAIRRILPAGDGSSIGSGSTTGGTFAATQNVDDAGATTSLGVPPSLMIKFDPSVLADTPRAIPLAALGMSTSSGATASVSDAVAAFTASLGGGSSTDNTAAAGGLSADQLTAGGLSAAVASFAGDFAAAEKKFNLPSGVLAAVAQAESGGRTDAVSSAGAEGLMQLMPTTAAGLGVANPFDPQQAINGAAQYLSSSLTAFDGSLTKALAAYNAGPGAVRKYDGVPPYSETQNYVRKVTDMLARLS